MKSELATSVSTGTPGGLRKHRPHHLICQITGSSLHCFPGVHRFGIHFGPRLAYPRPGGFPRHFQGGFAFGVPLLVRSSRTLKISARAWRRFSAFSPPPPRLTALWAFSIAPRYGRTSSTPPQWPLNQKLVCQNQRNKEQKGGRGAEQ